MKIYDAFNFFNELELLEIRLNILNDSVDYFVIVESTLTHSGLEKELYFKNNRHLFKEFDHKIIHVVIDHPLKSFEDARERLKTDSSFDRTIIQEALSSDSVPKTTPAFLRDFYEKEYVKKALVNLSDDDFCFISDLDEIWNPAIKLDYTRDDVFKFRQLSYAYYLNNRSSEPWVGTTATKYATIKNNCLNDIRNISKTKHTFVDNGGWHFTYQGGKERLKKKIESFSHQEFNNVFTKLLIQYRMLTNKDIVNRQFKFWIDEKDLPKYILDNKEKYKAYFK